MTALTAIEYEYVMTRMKQVGRGHVVVDITTRIRIHLNTAGRNLIAPRVVTGLQRLVY